MNVDVKCYVIVLKIYDRNLTTEEFVHAYVRETDAKAHLASLRIQDNEECKIVMVPLRFELVAGIELLNEGGA